MSKVIQSHILKEYEIVKQLGSGSYGHVWEVISKRSNKKYALKKVFDAFRNVIDSQRTYREVAVLSKIESKYIIKLIRVIRSKSNKDVYLLFQPMQTDLLKINGMNIMSNEHKKYVIFQILRGIDFLHRSRLIHRDLKPANILINQNSEIKICDFGLVRSYDFSNLEEQRQQIMTQKVATRWYRAPQLLLGSQYYTQKIDIWSIGCIAAQLLLKKPIFDGVTTDSQIVLMLQINQELTEQDYNSLKLKNVNLLKRISKDVTRKPLSQIFSKEYLEYLPFLQGCFQINPNKRLSLQRLLSLRLFDSIRHLAKVQTNYVPFTFSLLDSKSFQISQYQNKIYQIAAADKLSIRNTSIQTTIQQVLNKEATGIVILDQQKEDDKAISSQKSTNKLIKNPIKSCSAQLATKGQNFRKSFHTAKNHHSKIRQENNLVKRQYGALFKDVTATNTIQRKGTPLKKHASEISLKPYKVHKGDIKKEKRPNQYAQKDIFVSKFNNNKYNKKGKQNFFTQGMQIFKRQRQQDRILLQKYSMHINSSINKSSMHKIGQKRPSNH